MDSQAPVARTGAVRTAAVSVPIESRSAAELPYAEFLSGYVAQRRPLVVRGAANAWPAVGKWTPQFFAQRFPDKLVQVSYDERMTFAELIAGVLASTADKPGPYLYRLFLHEHLPEVLADLSPPNRFSYPRWYASPLMREYWRRPDGYLKLLIGGIGGRFPVMHYDGENAHATITQIYGEKEFIVYKPEDSERLYPNPSRPNHSQIDDPVRQDLERFPLLAKATQYRTVLGPGDMVFVPCRFWHSARALSVSISVGTNILDHTNWRGFLDEVSGRPVLAPKWLLARAYWEATGAALLALDAVQRRFPRFSRAVRVPALLAPASSDLAPDPADKPLRIRAPTG